MDGATPSQRDIEGLPMTIANIIIVVDRSALSLMNSLALIVVPLIALGVLTQAF